MTTFAIKERPILMSAPMVRALLAGMKTQTRRAMKPQPPTDMQVRHCWFDAPVYGFTDEATEPSANWWKIRCPYGKPGDRLRAKEAYYEWGKWVQNGTTKSGRKAWKFVPVGGSIRYMDGNKPTAFASRNGECGWVYRHSRFMPKAHSRITLEITEVRVQRLQEISEADSKTEGARSADHATGRECLLSPELGSYRLNFRSIWESINGPGSWDTNPWVWAVSFKRVDAPEVPA